ncbi:MAG: hypothetical protein D6725_15875, partial [Planctomycetota bacterium]
MRTPRSTLAQTASYRRRARGIHVVRLVALAAAFAGLGAVTVPVSAQIGGGGNQGGGGGLGGGVPGGIPGGGINFPGGVLIDTDGVVVRAAGSARAVRLARIRTLAALK